MGQGPRLAESPFQKHHVVRSVGSQAGKQNWRLLQAHLQWQKLEAESRAAQILLAFISSRPLGGFLALTHQTFPT